MMRKKIRFIMLCMILVFLLVMPVKASTKLSAPKLKSVSLTSSTTVAIRWNKVRNAKSYVIYFSKNGGKFRKLATTKDLIYVHKKLNLGTKYNYKVKAVSGKVTSNFSKLKGIKTKSEGYLLDFLKPYETPFWYQEYNGLRFSMGGDSYTHGFTCMGHGDKGKGNVTYFNLHGNYSKISFVSGVVEKARNEEEKCTLIIYKDGIVAASFVIDPDKLPKKHVVNIKNCKQLKICVTDGYWGADGSGTYGLANIKVYK